MKKRYERPDTVKIGVSELLPEEAAERITGICCTKSVK